MQLQTLFDKNIPGSSDIPVDSVITWIHQLEPFLLNGDKLIKYFEIELLIIDAYCSRGDISLAVDRVRRMVTDAVDKNSSVGFALASVGIGDTYINSNMAEEAIQSYTDALQLLEQHSNTLKYQKITILKLIHAFVADDRMAELSEYLGNYKNLFQEDTDEDPLWVYFFLYSALYEIRINEPENAAIHIAQAEKILANEPTSLRTLTLYFITANYYKQINEPLLALDILKKIPVSSEKRLGSNRYTQLSALRAEIYSTLGNDSEAALLYQRIVHVKDSLNVRSYARQVNALRAIYQVNQIELDNQTQKNRYINLFIGGALIFLLLGVLLAGYIIHSTKQLRKSKEDLEIAKKKAENSMKTKSMILSNMSHEIRTPLNALTGFSAILTDDTIDNETRQQCNDIIQQNSELLLKLIDDVIDLSSLEFGKMQFTFMDKDVVRICRNVTDTVDKVKQTGAQVLFETDLDSLVLYTDEARLQQVLFNLLINATKFTSHGQIVLKLSLPQPNKALFSVTDTGCGIAPEKQKRIFERFEKLDELAQGTGLGLSISQLIINHIGGNIWIDPDYTDGSRFFFTHPVRKQSE